MISNIEIDKNGVIKSSSSLLSLLPNSNAVSTSVESSPIIPYEELSERVSQYMNEQAPSLDVNNMKEASQCFQLMKNLYNTRMKEYVTELTFISEKLSKYDEIINKRKNLSQTSLNQVLNTQFSNSSSLNYLNVNGGTSENINNRYSSVSHHNHHPLSS